MKELINEMYRYRILLYSESIETCINGRPTVCAGKLPTDCFISAPANYSVMLVRFSITLVGNDKLQ